MQLTTTITNLVLLFLSLLTIVSAAPLAELERRDVYTPPVLYPHAGTVWKIGNRHNVTWDVSDPPVNITNKIGFIVLRKGNLATNITLASGFNILQGRVEVTVPKVTPASDYSLVLFGDSGNFSPKFKITK
ncbi:hypothetical protein FA95DRAFT_1579052 [Auriscalpium vulgare]|uniref:Uncharacterized protein n=1 Tax=Auriscalpium vulgare TaxID=40419 RepID=A0ACB8SDG1_9AGAM|nr:hypothetical protein FA95DRAFT_1579052 [Auriscalpium vulgare]